MNATFHRDFAKQWRHLTIKQRAQATDRLVLFRTNPTAPQLKNHPLTGEWRGHRSINISGDLRAVYRQVGANGALFVAIGTHSQLYR